MDILVNTISVGLVCYAISTLMMLLILRAFEEYIFIVMKKTSRLKSYYNAKRILLIACLINDIIFAYGFLYAIPDIPARIIITFIYILSATTLYVNIILPLALILTSVLSKSSEESIEDTKEDITIQ